METTKLSNSPKQIELSKRNARICETYQALRSHYPESSDASIFREIARRHTIGAPTVRLICKAAGVC